MLESRDSSKEVGEMDLRGVDLNPYQPPPPIDPSEEVIVINPEVENDSNRSDSENPEKKYSEQIKSAAVNVIAITAALSVSSSLVIFGGNLHAVVPSPIYEALSIGLFATGAVLTCFGVWHGWISPLKRDKSK